MRSGGFLAVAAACALLAASAHAASHATNTPLTGETLLGGTTTSTNVSCNPDGSGSFDFATSGTALGPYPGTFTETGHVAIDATSGVTQFRASFHITSGATRIDGVKTQAFAGGTGGCVAGGSGCTTFASMQTDYQATIVGPDGQSKDSGETGAAVNASPSDCLSPSSFAEVFQLSNSPGKVNGGGKLDFDNAQFSLDAKSDKKIDGHCEVKDKVQGVTVKCRNVIAFSEDGNTATFTGDATQNGQPVSYSITVTDNGEPGKGRDTFHLETTGGVVIDGIVTEGNIQVH